MVYSLLIGFTVALNNPATDPLPHGAAVIRTIEPADGDFEDLAPLKDRIGSTRIVVLGEAQHEDGATFRAKSRLVRFLHQEMGFDVLIWEAGFINGPATTAALRSDCPIDAAADHMIAGGWSRSLRPLWQYIRHSWDGPRPIDVAGCDGGRAPYAVRIVQNLLADLYEASPKLEPDEKDRARIESLCADVLGFLRGPARGELAVAEREAQREALSRLLESARVDRIIIEQAMSPRDAEFLFFTLEQILAMESRLWSLARGTIENNIDLLIDAQSQREQMMANQVRWLAETRYPDRKLIVWAATAHFIRNGASIEALEQGMDFTLYEQAGDRLKRTMREPFYTIAFTSHSGRNGPADEPGAGRALRPAPEGSVEHLLHELGSPFLFVDLRSLPAVDPLREPIVARPLGYNRCRARWPDVIDAFFFIDQQEPDRVP